MARFAIVTNGTVVNVVMAGQTSDLDLTSGQTAIQHDTASIGWGIVSGVLTAPSDPPSKLPNYAASRFASAITHGTVTVSSFQTGTDESSQGYISRTMQLMETASLASVNWNGNPATPITLSQLTALGVALGQYVQAAFNALGAAQTGIASGSITSTAQIDALAWPVSS